MRRDDPSGGDDADSEPRPREVEHDPGAGRSVIRDELVEFCNGTRDDEWEVREDPPSG